MVCAQLICISVYITSQAPHNGVMSNSTHPIAMVALLIVESGMLASGIDREKNLVVAITSKV
jgi:hypothetical protein